MLLYKVLVSVLVLSRVGNVMSHALKVFVKGYNNRNLPPGGWTQWFNVDHPTGGGDFETYANIVRMYGRSCMGIPCRRPLGMKAISIYGQTPNANGNLVQVNPRTGLKCHTAHQQQLVCQDYRVRFYCPNLHTKCSQSRFYPHHHGNNKTNNVQKQTQAQPEINAKSAKTLSDKLLDYQMKQAISSDSNILIKRKQKRTVKRKRKLKKSKDGGTRRYKWTHNNKTVVVTAVRTSKAFVVTAPTRPPSRLAYHPRHPV